MSDSLDSVGSIAFDNNDASNSIKVLTDATFNTPAIKIVNAANALVEFSGGGELNKKEKKTKKDNNEYLDAISKLGAAKGLKACLCARFDDIEIDSNDEKIEEANIEAKGAVEGGNVSPKMKKTPSKLVEDAEVALSLLKLYRNLCRHELNRSELISRVDVVFIVLNVFKSHIQIQAWGLSALANLAFSIENQNEMINQGVIDVILVAMKTHISDADVEEQGCAAIKNLGMSTQNQIELVKQCAGDIVLAGMRWHINVAPVQVWGCGAIKNLSIAPENQVILMEKGAGDVIIQSLKVHTKKPEVVEQGCGAICNLAMNTENKTELRRRGAGDVLIQCLLLNDSNQIIQEKGCGALRQLSNISENVSELVKRGIIDAIGAAMKNYPDNLRIQELCFKTFRSLTSDEDARVKIMKKELIPHLFKSMQKFAEDADLQENGCTIVWNIAMTPKFKDDLIELGAKDVIKTSMKNHRGNSSVKYAGTYALRWLGAEKCVIC